MLSEMWRQKIFRDVLLPAILGITIVMASPAVAATATSQPATRPAWVADPPQTWPQVNLTNFAAFRGSTFLTGASAFLMEIDGQVYVASARHLIGSAGGVEPNVALSELDAKLLTWLVFPRTEEQRSIRADMLAISRDDARKHDWLLMRVPAGQRLPAEPLRPATRPVEVGQTVYLIGVPYSEPKAKQNVYEGRVTDRQGDWFGFALKSPVQLNGFSGAPIINQDGQVVGQMAIWFKRVLNDAGQDRFAGGHDVTVLLKLHTDGPTTRPDKAK